MMTEDEEEEVLQALRRKRRRDGTRWNVDTARIWTREHFPWLDWVEADWPDLAARANRSE